MFAKLHYIIFDEDMDIWHIPFLWGPICDILDHNWKQILRGLTWLTAITLLQIKDVAISH
jgi:hypothetical protein